MKLFPVLVFVISLVMMLLYAAGEARGLHRGYHLAAEGGDAGEVLLNECVGLVKQADALMRKSNGS